tara:strand:- start:1135 stop:1551 length:417 start_codon:yes stop_codon:yes gene_type:complete
MDLEELDELSRINFGHPLDRGHFEGLMSWLSEHLKLRIDYSVNEDRRVGEHHALGGIDKGAEIRNINYSGFITASGKYRENGANLVRFKGEKSVGVDCSLLDSLQFDLTPGWDLNEYSKGERMIWQDVKKECGTYLTW